MSSVVNDNYEKRSYNIVTTSIIEVEITRGTVDREILRMIEVKKEEFIYEDEKIISSSCSIDNNS